MLLQGTTPTPSISLGQLLGLVVAVLSITSMIVGFVVAAYKLGGMKGEIKISSEGWSTTLKEIKDDVTEMKRDIQGWTAWRAQITEQVDQLERRHRTEPNAPHRRAGEPS